MCTDHLGVLSNATIRWAKPELDPDGKQIIKKSSHINLTTHDKLIQLSRKNE